ncbi:iron complex outermembrane recepter protein [Cyclobacterium lianum]|uniref:Iron complex outermembrane recepter protein n=1 Tax=Cyclobacterium lianum TaxID=388280 RepID=A0A1M7JJJ5_9BACT|nr:TonB-dependent receptor [Cyclobacterium lianum]SHM53279.1 iron complex outermembrane recepter protein [Cyclobacterium lianum]
MKFTHLFTFLLVASYPIYAQEDSTSITLDQVIIKENRMEIPFSRASRNINIIHRKALETTPARSLQEILTFTPGLDVRQRGIAGVQADIGIRGGSFEQTLMLVNGIKLSDPQTGHHMVNIPVPLAGIQRVDILKGPASRIYGQNAYAGAINIITELPESFEVQANLYGGDFAMRGGSFRMGLPIGKYRQSLAVSHDASDGHWYNSDYRVGNVFYEGGLAVNQYHEFKTMIAYADRDFGANGFYTSSFPDQWESIQTTLASLSHTFEKGGSYISTRAYWRKNQDEFRLVRNDPEVFQNIHQTNVLALEINARQETGFGTLGMGLESRRESIDSNNLGLRDRDLMGAFLEHRLEFSDKGDIRAGIYSNYYSEYGWRHFPGAELGYQLNSWIRGYANFGVSFRIPTYTDLYYVGPTNIGNDALEPEKAQNYEGGFKISKEGLNAELVYFNRHTNNLIEWTRPDADTPWQPQNFNEVSFQGVEAGIQYQFGESSNAIRLDEVSLSYNYIAADLIEMEGQETQYSLNALKHQFITGLRAEYRKNIELTLKSRYIERMKLAPYFLLDIRMDVNRLKKIGFFAEISNLSNTDYIEAGTVQMPGRWARGGVSYNFNK